MKKRVTIVGTGNAGLTAAYHFAYSGVDVCLYGSKGFDAPLDAIRSNNNTINAMEGGEGLSYSIPGLARVDLVTNDIKEAAQYSEFIIMPVPAFAQQILFEQLLPHLVDNTTIVLMPGNFGSLALDHIRVEHGFGDLKINFAETNSIPWACRATDPASIAIFGIKEYIEIAVLDSRERDIQVDKLRTLFPIPLKQLGNILEAGVGNINFGAHPLMTVMNIGLLENFPQQFNYYTDCCSASTARVADALDAERLSIANGLGLNVLNELDSMNALYGTSFDSVYAFNTQSSAHSKLNSAPDSAQHRYISEDVPYLMVPIYCLGKALGLDLPIIDACIQLSSAMNAVDYKSEGRNLKRMGISCEDPLADLESKFGCKIDLSVTHSNDRTIEPRIAS